MNEASNLTTKAPLTNKGAQSQKVQKPELRQSMDSPVEKILFLQRTIGNQGVGRLIRSGVLQAKLRIGQPGDEYEQEADRVADQVMRMPEPQKVSTDNFHIRRACPKCDENELKRKPVKEDNEVNSGIEEQIHSFKGGGTPLSEYERAFFEPRFGADLSHVRIHTDAKAAETAQAVNAKAFTVERNVVFGEGQYAPEITEGKRLLAHELTHVLQQSGSEGNIIYDSGVLQRACLSGSVCNTVSGSAQEFSDRETIAEAPSRSRRSRMSPARMRASGHAGHARQLERFLEDQTPGLLSNIHGIFIDQDISPNTGAFLLDCASFDPPITGATKPCVFVPARLNQQALIFNTSRSAATIGSQTREDWRVDTLQTLTHEVQHELFRAAPHPAPAGVGAGCPRSSVEFELSELNSIMSEFPIAFRAIPAGAGASDPARVRLNNWFSYKITNPFESIQGALTKMRCTCECIDVDLFVRDTFNFTANSTARPWTFAEKNAFNSELRRPVWGLNWPL